MNRLFTLTVTIFGLLAILISAACAQPNLHITLVQGQSRILQVQNMTRVAIGDESVVDLVALDANQLLLNPTKTGITSLHLWVDQGQQVYQVRVVADDGTLIEELLETLNLPYINAWFIDKHLVLEGEVANKHEKERVEKIGAAYSDSIINLLYCSPTDLEQQLEGQIYKLVGQEFKVNQFNNTIILEGKAKDEAQRLKALRIAETLKLPIIDLIQVPTSFSHQEAVIKVDVADQIAQAIDKEIKVYTIEQTVFLEGNLANEYQHKRALAIAEAFNYPVVDLIKIKPEKEPEISKTLPEQDFIDQQLLHDLNQLIADPRISTRLIYEHIILQGQVEDSWDKHRALKLGEIFGLTVIDLIKIKGTSRGLQDFQSETNQSTTPDQPQLEELLANSNIKISWINGTLILEGIILDPYEKERALAIGQAYTERVIDLIRVQQPLEIKTPESDPAEEEKESDDRFYQELAIDLINALKEPGISINFYNGTLVLEGVVPTLKGKERAEKIGALFYQPIISFIEVPEAGKINPANQLAAYLDLPLIKVTFINGNIVLEGTVHNQDEHSRVLEIAGLYGQVVDLLTVSNPAQILLQVHVVELNRQVGQELGIKWGSLNEDIFVPNLTQFEEMDHIGNWVMNRSFKLASQLKALENEGNAKLLAAPSLLTLSGKTATFLAGGEIPILVVLGEQQMVEWREYGIRLEILPLVIDNKVKVTINPEVSSLDWDNSIHFNETALPGLKTRKTSTTVTVTHGNTIVISGLIQQEEIKHVQKVPILGDLPIIGPLFRSTEYQEKQTELVIFLTPWIIEE